MKILTKKELLPVSLILLSFIVGIILYSDLPDQIPSHWNARGEIDAWSSKDFGVFFFPGITVGIYLLMTFLPLIDPLKKNYARFVLPYFWFRSLFVLFFVSLYLYTLMVAKETNVNINYFILPAISLLFILIGLFLPKVKKNYFVGIKTPWTLHSEEVWDKTHQFSGKLFVAAGLISLAGLFFPNYAFPVFTTAVLLAAFVSIAYSYFVYRNIKESSVS